MAQGLLLPLTRASGAVQALVERARPRSLTHPDYFSQLSDRHLAASDLPRIRFHDLRHTHATILLKAGVH